MTTANEADNAAKAEELVGYLAQGGTIKNLAGIGPGELEAVYAVAYSQSAAGKHDKAITLLQFLVLQDHTNPRWYHALGVVQQKKGDFAAAVDAYGVATLLDVNDPHPQAQAGYCLMALGKWQEAKAALEGTIMLCKEKPGNDGILAQAERFLARVEEQLNGAGGGRK